MFEGVNASDGIGIGVARVAVDPDLSFTPHVPEDADAEKARYASAVAKFIEQTNAQIERMTQTVGEEAAAIMGAHIEFAEDDGADPRLGGQERRVDEAAKDQDVGVQHPLLGDGWRRNAHRVARSNGSSG